MTPGPQLSSVGYPTDVYFSCKDMKRPLMQRSVCITKNIGIFAFTVSCLLSQPATGPVFSRQLDPIDVLLNMLWNRMFIEMFDLVPLVSLYVRLMLRCVLHSAASLFAVMVPHSPPLFVLVLARLVWLFTTLLQLKTRISGPLMKLEDSTLVSKISPFFPTFVGWHGLDTSYGDQIWNQQNHSHLSAFLVGTVIFMDKSKCRSGPWKRMWSFLAFGWLVDLGNGRSNGPLSALT